MSEFVMPALGADMEYGTLLEWRVAPGQHVERGQVVAVVETDKAAIEVEVFDTGTVEELLVQPGTRVPVRTPLARIRPDSGAPSPAPPSTPPEPALAEPSAPAAVTTPAATATPPPPRPAPAPDRTGRPRVSPLARRLAAELGVDLATVRGTGHLAAVTRADVEAAARGGPSVATSAPVAVPPSEERERSLRMRRAIAAAMERANREIPHYFLEETVDLSRAMRWLEERDRGRPARERLLPVALFVRAVALAALEVPELNGYWRDGRHEASEHAHVGLAVSLRDSGLVAPAILEAERKPAEQIMAELVDLARRARRGGLRGSEMTSATITVTSLGDLGVERVYGVIHPPQVALVGFGAVRERPWAEHGMLDVRPAVAVTLAADHRASDGYTGARFLEKVARLLRDPEGL